MKNSEKTVKEKEFYISETLPAIYTNQLNRDVIVELIMPANWRDVEKKYPLLVLNDGQDNDAMELKQTVEALTREGKIRPLIIAAVVAGDRLQEYGVSARADFKKRGKKAKAYGRFITEELLPFLIYQYPVEPDAAHHTIAGYSMGGLSAIDIAWNYPDSFLKAGAFSGSFWWRKRDAGSRFYSEARDRLMHAQVRKGKFKQGLKFWFQAGTRDEGSDRNKNGVIDSIDDTLDLITELTKKGYRPFHDIQYIETKGGEHNHKTWKKVMPQFLEWAFKEPGHPGR